jgi:hypothetical protein
MSAFAALLSQPGVEEVSELRGRVGFMAYHGGALEAMTDVIARRAAERSGASCYSVIQPPGMRDHLPSIKVDPDESAVLGDVHRARRRGDHRARLRPARTLRLVAPRGREPALRRARRRSAPADVAGLRHPHRDRLDPRTRCVGCIPRTPSTCRGTVACRSSCHRAFADRARCGGTGRAPTSHRTPSRSSTGWPTRRPRGVPRRRGRASSDR